MNTAYPRPTSHAGTRAPLHQFASARWTCVTALLALALGAGFTGCSFLKPAKPTARYFVLTPLPPTRSNAAAAKSLAVGIGKVKLPAYLFDTSFAVRKGTNEVEYLPSVLWAERLDAGCQRSLAANLATLLPSDQVRLSAWQSSDVVAEVYVAIEQFDVDARGQGVIVASWRVVAPGGEKTLKAGECRLARQGPPPQANPSGAVATLSDLLAELSRQLARALQVLESAPKQMRASDLRGPHPQNQGFQPAARHPQTQQPRQRDATAAAVGGTD